MIEVKVNRQQILDFLVETMLDKYHEDLFDESNFNDNKGGWIYRDRVKITMFEAVIYHEAEEEGMRDMSRDEMLSVKKRVLELIKKAS